MIRTVHRTKGASALGATGPGTTGPFGSWPDPDEDDDQDDEQQDGRPGPADTGAVRVLAPVGAADAHDQGLMGLKSELGWLRHGSCATGGTGS